MSPLHTGKNSEFISLADAATLVGYSRDYVGRLAREGKIISQQINKQWFINQTSLVNFFELSAIEDSVKKRILSVSRKNDLEVKDVYQKRMTIIQGKTENFHVASLVATVLIIAGGLCAGVLVDASGHVAPKPTSFVSIFENLALLTDSLESQNAAVAGSLLFSDAKVIETEEKIPMEGGIVIFPAGATTEETQTVQELFSDEVEVVLTSTTTGLVKMNGTEKSLPFVRVPDQTQP
ncbi:MAG: helix-turn-helix domain-containing protein [Patescibacteria group bacterium]